MPTLKTSISGIRGIVNDGLDIATIVNYTSAFASTLPSKASVLIGRDTRLTGEYISKVVSATLEASAVDVVDAGIIPTPTASYMVDKLNLNGGIIITASHNPIEWNALKLVGKGGIFLNKESVEKLIENYNKKASRFVPALKTGKYIKIDNAIEEHIKRILRFIDASKIKKAKLKVACDYVNGTGLVATPPLLKELGVKEFSINNTITGKFAHLAEPSVAAMKDLSKLVKENNCDIGFMQDPDADRLAIVLNDGTIVSEEYTLALCAKYLWMLGTGDAAVNLSTSRMIDDLAKEAGAKVLRTEIGEINVSECIRKKQLYFGGEGNGGIIVPSVTPGRDSLLGIALILHLMAETKKSISELVDSISKYHIVKEKIETETFDKNKILKKMKDTFKDASINDIDGVKADFADGWVHIRSSNTEPVVRIIAEAKSVKIAKDYIESIKKIL